MKNRLIILWLVFLALPGYAGQTSLGREGIQSVLLSPGGEHIAILNRVGDVDQLQIVDMARKSAAYSRKTASPQRVHSIDWIDDERLLLQLGVDRKYQVEVQPTGEIEVLSVLGESMFIGGASSGNSDVHRALDGKELAISNGLSSTPGVFLVSDQQDRALNRVDLAGDLVEVLDSPPIKIVKLFVSANSKYMVAEGISDSGDSSAMVWSDVDDRGWRGLDGDPEFAAVTDSGIALAIMDVAPGIAGLVSIAVETGDTTVLFQDDSFTVDQVMLDGSGQAVAVRYVPGLPQWFYFDNNNRLAQLHKAFRAGTPQADFSFVSASNDGRSLIARQTDDDNPGSYFVVDTVAGRADRLVESKRALSIVGGDEDDTYTLRPIHIESGADRALTGFISLPRDGVNRARATVVVLRDRSDNSRWQWKFDEETWFFHRQGFNVLMLNGESIAETAPNSGVSQIESAIDWLVEQDLADAERVCLYGRGTGAELALLTVLQSDVSDCAISLGGTFENSDLVVQAARDSGKNNRRLGTLLIFGTDYEAEHLASQDKIRDSLVSLDIAVDLLPVEGERRVFSLRQNELRALARISSFLYDHLERKDQWSTMPLTYEQAIAMNALHEALAEQIEKGILKEEDWQRWFKANDREVRELLFEEQLPIFETYQAEIIAMVEGEVGMNYRRFSPMREIPGS